MEEQKKFIAPRSITINNFEYTYKNDLANDFYSYRCKHRLKCKIIIKIKATELSKYLENKSIVISYSITSSEKEHTCKKQDISTNDYSPINEDKKVKSNLIKSLILCNIEKPISFHQANLKTNNIFMTQNQLKWVLQKIREEKFPTNEKFLSDISNIKINLDNTALLNNLPFCYKFSNFINPEKKNCLEKYIIFTSKFQINMLNKCTQLYIDGTFKITPIGYYQVIIIGGFLPEIKGIIPIFFIPTTGKSQYLYEVIFRDVKTILEDNNIDYKNITNQYMLDFEISLQNAIKTVFENIKISGCYFHYVKILWQKSKIFGLCTKNEMKITKILLFILKIMPYMEIDDREDIFKKLEEFYNSNEKYKKLLKYYKKFG